MNTGDWALIALIACGIIGEALWPDSDDRIVLVRLVETENGALIPRGECFAFEDMASEAECHRIVHHSAPDRFTCQRIEDTSGCHRVSFVQYELPSPRYLTW